MHQTTDRAELCVTVFFLGREPDVEAMREGGGWRFGLQFALSTDIQHTNDPLREQSPTRYKLVDIIKLIHASLSMQIVRACMPALKEKHTHLFVGFIGAFLGTPLHTRT